MIDDGLRRCGAFSSSIPDAIKLTLWRLAKNRELLREDSEAVLIDLASFLTYCFMGEEDFTAENGAELSQKMHKRLEMTQVFDEGIDAEIVLLALHSGIAHGSTAGRFSAEIPERDMGKEQSDSVSDDQK
ncbi:hypothetical protein [Kiloniella laminariae]|uniref:hypothetical protein n=1 Tax=Kiloniella laminariae TaxID=454162 RepID=UPI00146B9E50|nr:hypothetical protein [Kiloniella laminariae]